MAEANEVDTARVEAPRSKGFGYFVFGFVLLYVAGGVSAQAWAGGKVWEWHGHFIEQPSAEVWLRTGFHRPTGERRMVVKPENVQLVCDDGSTLTYESEPTLGYRFVDRRIFFQRKYSWYTGPAALMYGRPFYEARGRIRSDGTVRGYYRDQDDHPPYPGDTYDPPDCSTDGELRFKATRLPSRR